MRFTSILLAICTVLISSCGGGGGGSTGGGGGNGGEVGGTPAQVVQITTSGNHNCVRFDNGRIKCWGVNLSGQLGLGDSNNRGDRLDEMGDSLPAINLGTGRVALEIAAGSDAWGSTVGNADSGFTCARLDMGAVKCWGQNGLGELGQGDTAERGSQPNQMGDNLPAIYLGTGRTAVQIVAGDHHACARLDNGAVKCWGSNQHPLFSFIGGQLGLGDTNARGDQPNEMGDNLPVVNLGTGRTAVRISAGGSHTCAILDNGALKCWGVNAGTLGLGDTNARGDQLNEMGDNLPAINLGTGRTVVKISSGGSHICAILDNGDLKCWGSDSSGQLGVAQNLLPGNGDPLYYVRGDLPGDMGDNLPAVNLGTGRKAVQIAAGGAHTCAILDNGALKCWGDNSSGQLGLGDSRNRGNLPSDMDDNLPAVNLGTGRSALEVSARNGVTCARLDNGEVKCWGDNYFGKLGFGDPDARSGAGSIGDQANEVGDNLPAANLGTIATIGETIGGAPDIHVNPTAINFGNVGVGSNAARTVTVSNSGNAALTIGAITSPNAPFSRTGGTCTDGQTLAVGASCTITLQFAPSAAGAANGSFNIPSNDPDSGTANGQNNALVTLSGGGGTGSSGGTFVTTGRLVTARNGHTATLLPNGRVFVAGGISWDGTTSTYLPSFSPEIYDPATGAFAVTGSPLQTRTNHTATLLADGKVLIAGGRPYPAGGVLSLAQLYDPATGLITTTGSLREGRTGHTATRLPNGKVLVAGGSYQISGTRNPDGSFTPCPPLTICPDVLTIYPAGELYEPTTGTFAATGSLATGRTGHTATLLANGKVLIAGGYYGDALPATFPAAAELYDPAMGVFTATGSLATGGRSGHTATLLPNGKVLIAGGGNGGVSAPGSELYDPATGGFTSTGSLVTERAGHTAALLANGKVLIAGGIGNSTYLSSAELYDPATGNFTATGGFTTARSEHTATLLTNDMVLLSGGYNQNNVSLFDSQLYAP